MVQLRSLRTNAVRDVPQDQADIYMQHGGYEVVQQTPADYESMGMMDVAGQALSNIPESAAQLGSDIVQPILHPIDTAGSLVDLAQGVYEKLMPGDQGYEKEAGQADAVGEFFTDRYGGVGNIKKTIAEDPMGTLSDLAALLTGGGTIAAKAPSILGKAGKAAATIGKAVDPLAVAGRATKLTSKALAKPVAEGLGVSTGMGSGRPIEELVKAGVQGGDAKQVAGAHMRGRGDITDIVADAKEGVSQLYESRSSDYRQSMKGIKESTKALDFEPILDAVIKEVGTGSYHGKTVKRSAVKARHAIEELVLDWGSDTPELFHTAEGLDQLKQAIWDVSDQLNVQPRTASAHVVDAAYNAVKKQIKDKFPEYHKAMEDYSVASETIREIEKTFSLSGKSTQDAMIRKLQSTMRDNVNTNFGQRAELAGVLAESSPDLMPALAGQSARGWMPRGVVRGGALPAGVIAAQTPELLPLAALASPRVVGEGALAAGSVARRAGEGVEALSKAGTSPQSLAEIARQSGREERITSLRR